MVNVTIVGEHKGPVEMLQRRVGGILKDIANVDTCYFNDIDKTNADIYVLYHHGDKISLIKDRFKKTDKKVITAELTILPAGIRLVNTIIKGSKITVVGEHLRCANYFLGEIIKCGAVDYNFVCTSLDEIRGIPIEILLVPEEIKDLIIKFGIIAKKILYIPRSITAACASELINTTLQIS